MQKDFKVVIDIEARADIKNIHAYYLMQSLSYEVADMVTDRIFGTAYGLAFMPHTRPMILEYNDPNYRKTICGDYIIPFYIDQSTHTVLVTRVFHGKSNYQKYL